jgi:predicted DNA-binding transcriptional regulator YafY
VERFDRIFRLHRILRSHRHPVPRRKLEEALECSRATVKRIIEDMRDNLNAPIVYDRARGGYHYDTAHGTMFDLPGVWLGADELHALAAAQQLLGQLEPGLLARELAPIRERIQQLLSAQHASGDEIPQRVRILGQATRPAGPWFREIAGALGQRRRLRLRHLSRARGEVVEREVSPQRLVHYRDAWYLDAWCHLKNELRTFGLDAIEQARALGTKARDVPDPDLDAHFASAYGIVAGPATHTAVLHFTPQSARWVAQQEWHPQQEAQSLPDGGLELRIPYGNPTELVMDILRHGPDVEVVAPQALRDAVAGRLAAAAATYRAT